MREPSKMIKWKVGENIHLKMEMYMKELLKTINLTEQVHIQKMERNILVHGQIINILNN